MPRVRVRRRAAERHRAAVWATPDALTAEAWLIREIEEQAVFSGTRLPRLLSPAEDWLLWRQCTSEATRELDLLNRGALAESVRRAWALAVEYGIDPLKLPLLGAEAELFGHIQRAVEDRCRALGASAGPPDGVDPALRDAAGAFGNIDVRRLSELAATAPDITGRRAAVVNGSALVALACARPCSDDSDELESIAEWCKQQIAKQPDARLLVVLPGGAGPRERLATLIHQAVDPAGQVFCRSPALRVSWSSKADRRFPMHRLLFTPSRR